MTGAAPRQPADERLLSEERLRRRSDFLRCYETGRRRHGAYAVLHSASGETGGARLGITASRKLGGAVQRHRLKRRVREIYRRWNERRSLPRLDMVVHLKPAAAQVTFLDLRRDLLRLLRSQLPARGDRPPGSQDPPQIQDPE